MALILSILVFLLVYLIFLQEKLILINHEFPGPKSDTTFHSIPDFAFLNQYGDTISSDDYNGNVYVANFVFTTCPTICPVMTYQMSRIQQKMKNYPNFKLLSHTVNPEYDSPQVLLEYANEMQVDTSLKTGILLQELKNPFM